MRCALITSSRKLVTMVRVVFSRSPDIQFADLLGSSRFRTDADISRGFAGRERDLQRWEAGPDANVGLSLEPTNGQSSSWDQFEVNERLYGLKTNYDENMYTTAIDKSHPDYHKRAIAADRIAREIESSSTSNAHVAEERGQKVAEEQVEDEEDK